MSSIGDISSMFSIGRSAFQAQEKRMATIQNNVANSSTPGYSQQRVDLESGSAAFHTNDTRGVAVDGVSSKKSPFLDDRILGLKDEDGYHSGRQQALKPVEATLNTGEEHDLTARISDFFGQMRKLSANPLSKTERQAMVEEGHQMATKFRQIGNTITNQRESIRQNLRGHVESVNTSLEEIARLDREIERATESGQHAGGLVDQRDRLVEDVSKQIGTQVVHQDDGTVHISTKKGQTLLEQGDANTLKTVKDNSGDYTKMHVEIEETAGGPLQDKHVSGRLGGKLNAHNDVLETKLDDLNKLAEDFASAFNDEHYTGTDNAGNSDNSVPAPFPNSAAFFTHNGSGEARTLEVNSTFKNDPDKIKVAGPGEDPGGNENIKDLIALQDTELGSANQTIETQARNLDKDIGAAIRDSKTEQEAISQSITQLEEVRKSKTGVSLEQQMVKMNEAQRAFQAASRVMQHGQNMFQTLMQIGRGV